MDTDIYRVVVGEIGGLNDEIQASIKEASLSLTSGLTSELRFTVHDPGFRMHNAGYFVIRRPVQYAGLKFEVSSVEVRYGLQEEVEVFCRSEAVQKMKRDKGTANFGKISPSAFAAQMAQKHGLSFFGESSPAKSAIIRQNTEQSQESTWDVLRRLANELKFSVFETDGMLYFASEEFIISKQTDFTVKYPTTEGEPFFLFDFTMHRSDDDVFGSDMRFTVERENGRKIRPGMVVSIDGIDYFTKKMMVTEVSWDVAVASDGLGDAITQPVKVSARTPKDSEDTGCETQTVKRGAKGACVKRLQQALKTAGFSPGSIDGIFGPLTEAAVKKFQKAKGLKVTGIVDPDTWDKFE